MTIVNSDPNSIPPPSTSSSAPPPITIAIIGAGIGGLTLALALAQHPASSSSPPLHITIYESRPSLSTPGAGVGFGPNAVQAMNLISPSLSAFYESIKTANLGAGQELVWYEVFKHDAVDADPNDDEEKEEVREEKEKQRGRLAKVWSTNGFVHGGASRKDFIDGLVRLLDESNAKREAEGGTKISIKFDMKIISIEELPPTTTSLPSSSRSVPSKLAITFSNQQSITVDALIGADGVRSTCRSLLLGAASGAVYSGKYAYRKVLDMASAVAAVGREVENRIIYSRAGGHVLTFPIMGGRGLNLVVFRDAEGRGWEERRWVVGSSREELLRDFTGWGEKPMRLLEMIDEPDKWALFDHYHPSSSSSSSSSTSSSSPPPSSPYSYTPRPNTTLLGDAAHATTPHCGAGAGFAIEDAHLLADLLRPDSVASPADVAAAFRAYDEVRRPRCEELVRRSREQGRRLDLQGNGQGEEGKGDEDGNEDVRVEDMQREIEETMHWVWEVDLQDMLRQARRLMERYKVEG